VAGFVLLGTLMIGASLLVGQWFYPDQVWMWFAATDGLVVAWREVIVVGLIALAVVREYYDNLSLRVVWSVAGAGLLWGGAEYFLDHPDLAFDAMLMVNAGICFAITAMQPAPEPILIPRPIEALLPSAILAYYARLRAERQLEQMMYLSDIKDNSHRLIMRHRPLAHT
jgi:hypothetical protein